MTVDMRSPRTDIIGAVGDDIAIQLTVLEDGDPYDFTGATVTSAILSNGTTVVTNWTQAIASNVLTLSLTDANTTTLGVATYTYWVKVTKAGLTRTWLGGLLAMHAPQDGTSSTSFESATLEITETEITVALTVGSVASGGGGADALDDLSDVTITAAASGDILRHNGSAWVDAVGTTHFDAAGSAAAAQAASQPLSAVLTATTASFTTADETKLDGIEALATADMSAAEILTAIKTVDGAGSGLDADLLDGSSSAAFEVAGAAAAAQAASQPLDSDLTAIAALSTTAYGRAFLALANQAALVALLPSYQPLAAVLTNTTASFLLADETKLDGIEALADVTDATNVNAAGAVMESDYNANTVLAATSDNTPVPLTVGASTFVGRKAAGDISAMSATEAAALLTDLVPKSLFDANTVLAATSDNTPAALTVGASTFLGRKAAGDISAMSTTEARTLLNVENGATNDQTAAEILAALLTVDGAASGLDADLLDGQSSAFYATATSVSDHLADAADVHAASAITFTPNGSIAATTVQAAIQEVRDEAVGGSGIRVEEEGSSVVAAATGLNFVGSAVTVTDAGSNEATVTITGGSSNPLDGNDIIATRIFAR
jgi:hypothetical protein